MRHLILLSACAAGAFAADATYNVGVGIADVTGPAANVNLMGYANPGQTAGGIHQRLRSRAFVFADPATQRRACFVSVDAGMCSQYMKNAVVAKLATELPGVFTTENLMISGTHTHSAPAGFFQYVLFEITSWGFVKEAADAFVDGITSSVLAAHKDVAPALLSLGVDKVDNTTVPGCPMPNCANINRSPTAYLRNPAEERARYSDGNTDHDMTMLRIDSADDSPRGMVNWYAVHGTSMNNTNSLLSGDNKGYASYRFEQKINGPSSKVRAGTGSFVAAFAQTNLGDVSPNTNGTYCMDTGLPCDSAAHSTCPNAKGQQRNAMCVSRGPGQDMFGSAEIIGARQFVAAQKIWDGATQDIGAGGVDYRHIFVDMGKQNVTLADGTFGKTCNPAMGYAFAAGTTDGPGAFDFTQGSNSSNPFWNLVSGFISKPTKEEEACHAPKPILLNTGDCTFPYPWSPHVVPVQLFRVGQLVILAVPTEFTTMAGRRMREAIKKLLVAKGALTSEGKVVIAGLANTYADYTTTFEEYQEQRYEGGSTLYGPHSHAAYVQIMSELATAMADGTPAPVGVPCPDYTSKQVELLPGVITDGTPLGKKFGDVVTDVAGTNFTAGARVFARWYAGCPRNDVRLEGTFSAVQRQGADGTWATVADDGDWETRFIWERESAISDVSYATVQWDIPRGTPPGTYRLVHTGDSKDILQKKKSYTGTSSAFTVTLDRGSFEDTFTLD